MRYALLASDCGDVAIDARIIGHHQGRADTLPVIAIFALRVVKLNHIIRVWLVSLPDW